MINLSNINLGGGTSSGGEGGTTNYNLLSNKPSINGQTLVGDKSAEDLDIATREELNEVKQTADDNSMKILRQQAEIAQIQGAIAESVGKPELFSEELAYVAGDIVYYPVPTYDKDGNEIPPTEAPQLYTFITSHHGAWSTDDVIQVGHVGGDVGRAILALRDRLSTRLATDLSNIDEEGVSRLNDLIYESDLSKDVQANGERIFNAQEDIQVLQNKVADIETSKDLGVIVVGNPNIKGSQVSGFSANNYLMMPRVIEFGNNPWQLDFQFTTGADVSQQQNLIDSQYGLALAIRNGHIVVAMSSDGEGWNLGEHSGASALSANTSYYVRMTFDGNKYEVFISTDGKTYASDIVVANTASLHPVQIYIGKSLDNAHIFGGSIYLYYASLSIAGTIVWTGTLGGELKDEVQKLEREVMMKPATATTLPEKLVENTIYGTPDAPIDIASGTTLVAPTSHYEITAYIQLAEGVTFGVTPTRTINDIPTEAGMYVANVKDGVWVFGKINEQEQV